MARSGVQAVHLRNDAQRAVEAARSEALLARADASKRRLTDATSSLLATLSHPVVRREVAAIERRLTSEDGDVK